MLRNAIPIIGANTSITALLKIVRGKNIFEIGEVSPDRGVSRFAG